MGWEALQFKMAFEPYVCGAIASMDEDSETADEIDRSKVSRTLEASGKSCGSLLTDLESKAQCQQPSRHPLDALVGINTQLIYTRM